MASVFLRPAFAVCSSLCGVALLLSCGDHGATPKPKHAEVQAPCDGPDRHPCLFVSVAKLAESQAAFERDTPTFLKFTTGQALDELRVRASKGSSPVEMTLACRSRKLDTACQATPAAGSPGECEGRNEVTAAESGGYKLDYCYELGSAHPPGQCVPFEDETGRDKYCHVCCPWTKIGGDLEDRISELVTLYALTGEAGARERAIEMLDLVTGWDTWHDPAYYPSLVTGALMRAVAYGYDILFRDLDDERKRSYRRALIEKGVGPAYAHLIREGYFDAFTNIAGSMAVGVVAAMVATAGEVSELSYGFRDVRGTITAADLIGHLAAYLEGVLDMYGRFDGHFEGVSYGAFTTGNLARAALMLANYDPKKYSELLDHDYFRRAFDYPAYLSKSVDQHPTAAMRNAPINDAGEGSAYAFTDDLLLFAFGDREPHQRQVWLLRYADLQPEWLSWFDMLFFDDREFRQSSWAPHPLNRAFHGNGTVVMRSGFDSDDSLLVLSSGYGGNKLHSGHKNYDDNSFVLRGTSSWLLADAGQYQPDTDLHNTVVVCRSGDSTCSGQTEKYEGVLERRFFSKAEPGVHLAVGDAAASYGGELDRFRREVISLSPEYYLVYDDIAVAGDAARVRSLLATDANGCRYIPGREPKECLDISLFPYFEIGKGKDRLQGIVAASAPLRASVVTRGVMSGHLADHQDGVLHQMRLDSRSNVESIELMTLLVPSTSPRPQVPKSVSRPLLAEIEQYDEATQQVAIATPGSRDYVWFAAWSGVDELALYSERQWTCDGLACGVGYHRDDARLRRAFGVAVSSMTDQAGWSLSSSRPVNAFVTTQGHLYAVVVESDRSGVVTVADSEHGITATDLSFGPGVTSFALAMEDLPLAEELCNDVDDDGDLVVDEGCDDDRDGWYDGRMRCEGYYRSGDDRYACRRDWFDFDDDDASTRHDLGEICNDKDDDGDGATDEGCDDDEDGYWDAEMVCRPRYHTEYAGGNSYRCEAKWADADDTDSAVHLFAGADWASAAAATSATDVSYRASNAIGPVSDPSPTSVRCERWSPGRSWCKKRRSGSDALVVAPRMVDPKNGRPVTKGITIYFDGPGDYGISQVLVHRAGDEASDWTSIGSVGTDHGCNLFIPFQSTDGIDAVKIETAAGSWSCIDAVAVE